MVAPDDRLDVWEIACAELNFAATEHFAVKEIEFSWRARLPMFGPLRSTCSTSWRLVGAVGGELLSLAWGGLAYWTKLLMITDAAC